MRERVHAVLPDVDEDIKWNMPAYLIDGKIVAITAAFKRHAALNFWRGHELRESRSNTDGTGHFGKLGSVDDLPDTAELDRLILSAAQLAGKAPTPRQRKHEPKPVVELHPDFARALEHAPLAKATLDNFPPSCRREYLEWIAEAKKDATRAKRIAAAVEWLSEGKRRHWKYESC